MHTAIFALYRWHGTTKEAFREHYVSGHMDIGKRMPGLVSYMVLLSEEADAVTGPPRPDAFSIMTFESKEAFEGALESEAFAQAKQDNQGFIGHFDTYSAERFDLVGF